jgi:hypothetical protein
MTDSRSILYSAGKNDECFTPAYGVTPILEYIPPDAVVWCPFDTLESEFVKQISDTNDVCFSHIDDPEGGDFFKYQPDHFDIIISNPPFTGKRQIFERAIQLGKPFALLMTMTWLNDSAPKQLFQDLDLQLLMFDKRIHFTDDKKTTFSSGFYCWNFLPKQIVMKQLVMK